MDGSTKELVITDGTCNFCTQAQKALQEMREDKPNLQKYIDQIKKDGQGKKYDVLIGLSGGVDSSTALHYAISLGLRPLGYTVDNGWNTPLSDENILKMVEALNVPFYRKTIDLVKFRDLQAAFLRAGLLNIEIPTDHVIMATAFDLARIYDIKWILSGGNVVSESIMPESWSYNARDLTHIKDVYKKMSGKKLTGLPVCSLLKWNYYKWVKGIKIFYLLDYLDYNVKESKKLLADTYKWVDYGDKHEESIFTKWFQNFYLFEKFGIDKRKAHYSSLINSGQMTRSEARALLYKPPVYPKLGIEDRILGYLIQEHSDFKQDKWYDRIATAVRLWKSLTTFKHQ